MNNYEKYIAIHNEVMDRLEAGEITVEIAKEVNDLAFDRYIVESVEEDDNELEIFEESARQKYVEQLEKRKARVEKFIHHATGEKKKQYENELKEIKEKLYMYGTGAFKGGYNNKEKPHYLKNTKTGEITDKGRIVGFSNKRGTYTFSSPTDSVYGSNGGSLAKDQFNKDFGSKDPKNAELHDNINQRSKK